MRLAVLLGAALLSAAAPAPARPGRVPPEFVGGPWLNAAGPQTLAARRGRVVLVNFWVYSCINCHNSLPTLRRWAQAYGTRGLDIVGVHTPEFDSDRPTANVRAALAADRVTWPVVQDNGLENWNAWGVQSWPTFFLLDRQGRVRQVHVGEISTRFPQAIPGLTRAIEALLAER